MTGIRLWGICRECQRRQKVAWYDKHKEEKREAKNQRTRDLRERARQYVYDYLSAHPCVECGESDPRVLEFDHLGDKDKAISELISTAVSITTLKREVVGSTLWGYNLER
jgi:hypothetical protein